MTVQLVTNPVTRACEVLKEALCSIMVIDMLILGALQLVRAYTNR